MQKRILPVALVAIFLIIFIGFSCTKLDTTDIGSDLLPAVDNVNTFDTLMTINSSQGFFSDSTFIYKSEDMALGAINNDPLFGKTNAHVYVQFKPPYYPYSFAQFLDTLAGLDSVVLCLKYRGYWGDSNQLVRLEVKEVVDNMFRDSVFKINYNNYTANTGITLGVKDVDIRRMKDTFKFNNGRDAVVNQIRIKLDMSSTWVQNLFNRDTLAANPGNNAFLNDSIYRRFYNGIGIFANGGGNALLYVNIADTSSKIEVHYKRKRAGKIDSVYASLVMNASSSPVAANAPVSNAANSIVRARAGYPVSNPLSTEQYLQTSPGSFVNLDIPGLSGLDNRIIHRAELIVEQLPPLDAFDETFSPPGFLYVDLKDTGSTTRWKPIYTDLNPALYYNPDSKSFLDPFLPSQIDFSYFGGFVRQKTDPLGTPRKFYNINISKYVQSIVTRHIGNYQLRLYAPFNLYYPFMSSGYTTYNNNMAYGRIKIGSGSHPNKDYRLKLRIIYSKIK
ncbi:MAG: DUF4270 family protein [Chitinophagaceae bacterium]|nr:DUF4270 family protein [Chitinophagaceae bacterium]